MQPRAWSWLLARVFAIDISACSRPGCHGRLKIVDVCSRARLNAPPKNVRSLPDPHRKLGRSAAVAVSATMFGSAVSPGTCPFASTPGT